MVAGFYRHNTKGGGCCRVGGGAGSGSSGRAEFAAACLALEEVAQLQLPLHKNFTSEFLNREDNSKDLLGKHWQDKSVSDQSKRRLLQSICHQVPCAKLLKLLGLRESDECRLCKRLPPEVTPWLEGHI